MNQSLAGATRGAQPADTSAQGAASFNRKLSKREKKELKKKEKDDKLKGKENCEKGVAEKLYNELPESNFTRSISNPELVMRKRRELKLEKKLHEINDSGPNSGRIPTTVHLPHLSFWLSPLFGCHLWPLPSKLF